jgi:hypothetical protein
MPTYHVNDIGEYEFAKCDDNIVSCRRWAARAFPAIRVHVSRPYRFCETCQSAPVWMSQGQVQANDQAEAETSCGMSPPADPPVGVSSRDLLLV